MLTCNHITINNKVMLKLTTKANGIKSLTQFKEPTTLDRWAKKASDILVSSSWGILFGVVVMIIGMIN